MHICFVSQEYPPETGWGGIGTYTFEMVRALSREGHEVTVISRALDRPTVSRSGGVEVHRVLPTPDWARWAGGWRLNRVLPGFALAAAHRLRQIQVTRGVDVIEAAECRADSAIISLLKHRPKTIVRLHLAWIFVDRFNEIEPDRIKRFKYWLERLAIERADALTAPSRAVAELTSSWVDLSRREVAVVPNLLDASSFSVDGRENLSRKVVFAGRLERRKGVLELAKAVPDVLERCRGSSFQFVGAGEDSVKRLILSQVRGSDIPRLVFRRVPRSEMACIYQEAALCVVPSRWENYPYVLLESMASGTPVVATNVGGIPELVRNGTSGILVPQGDVGALSEAISTLLVDEGLRERMGEAARRRVAETCGPETVLPRMTKVYQRVMGLS